MANNTNDKNAFSKSGQAAEARELWGANPSALSCPKCDASKVATSRPQSGDQFRSIILPALPYRCLRCYHRFWLKENFFAKKARVVFWVVVTLILFLFSIVAISSLFGESSRRELASTEPALEAFSPRSNESESSGVALDEPQANGGQTSPQVITPGAAQAPAVIADSPVVDVDLSSQPALTLEQQKQQVKLAKQQAEAAAEQSQAKVEQIETTLSPDPLERESLAKVEVGYAIEQWRDAWSKGDVQTYLRQYSPSFKPSTGLSVDEWEAQRIVRVSPSKNINLVLTDFDMSFSAQLTKASVEFQQSYTAGAYSETSYKQLVLSKGASGWKIIAEITLEN